MGEINVKIEEIHNGFLVWDSYMYEYTFRETYNQAVLVAKQAFERFKVENS